MTPPNTPDAGRPQQFQRVLITLSDGTVGWFMGPAIVWPGTATAAGTVRVQFTEPQDLPADMVFMPWEEALV